MPAQPAVYLTLLKMANSYLGVECRRCCLVLANQTFGAALVDNL